jgi:hypothetical protein
MDHKYDGRAVEELKAALVAHKKEINAVKNDPDKVYDIINRLMTAIAKAHDISGQQMHDMWVDKYKQIPDTWIMEAAKAIDKGEYDHEGQMARTQLQTIYRNSKDLIDMLSDDENIPEWVQSKITLAQDYITHVRDYLQSREELEEDAKGYKNPTGGLTQKGRDHYNNQTGGNLKAPVTTPPSKLDPDSKAAKRRKSFCARMSGVEGPMKKPNGEPTRKALALRKWNC